MHGTMNIKWNPQSREQYNCCEGCSPKKKNIF